MNPWTSAEAASLQRELKRRLEAGNHGEICGCLDDDHAREWTIDVPMREEALRAILRPRKQRKA